MKKWEESNVQTKKAYDSKFDILRQKSIHQWFPLNRFCNISGSCVFLYPSLLAILVLNFKQWQAFAT